MTSMKKIIISGGGTGGHIFPAIAIANEIRHRYPDAEILFVGALGRMEMERVPAAGYKIIGLPVMGFPRKPSIKILSFFARLIKSNKMARMIIRDFNPQIAIGVGGYASGPTLRAASKKKIPCLVQEQNSYAGITNKILSKKVHKICVAYENMEKYFPPEKIVITGNPVRKNLLNFKNDNQKAFEHFELEPKQKVMLIVGGSLGARSINNAVFQSVEFIRNTNIQVIWQTGAFYFDNITAQLNGKKPPNLQIHKFISQMDFAYAVASVVISRAGAGTISELCLVGKPAILVPSPNVAEDHQTKNAMALVKKDAAVMIPDNEIEGTLVQKAFDLVLDENKCTKLSENVKLLAKPNATKDIVNVAENLLTE